MKTDEKQLDFRDVLQILWRRKWILALTIVVVSGATFLFSSALPKTYESSTVVEVNSQEIDTSLFQTAPAPTGGGSLGPAVHQIRTTRFARLAARRLDPTESPRALLGKISLAADAEGGVITITARDSDPRRAADIANAFGKATVTGRSREAREAIDFAIKEIEKQLDLLERLGEREQLSRQLQRLRAIRAGQTSNAQVLEPAYVPAKPVSPDIKRNTAVALLLSILLGVALAFLLERLDRRVRSPDELEDLTGLPVLSTVPRTAFPSGTANGVADIKGAEAEAFRRLRAGLIYFNVSRPVKSVMITSPAHSEGKTTVSVNLALAVARQGKHVVLIDADLHKPQVHGRLGVDGAHGLSRMLSGNDRLDEAMHTLEVGEGRVSVLPAGPIPPNPSELLASERMSSLLTTPADLIIVDTAPLLAVSDAIPLIDQVSGVMIVARIGATSRDSVQHAIQIIRTAHGTPLGLVATGVAAPAEYGYGYGYSAGANGQPQADEPAPSRGQLPAERA